MIMGEFEGAGTTDQTKTTPTQNNFANLKKMQRCKKKLILEIKQFENEERLKRLFI